MAQTPMSFPEKQEHLKSWNEPESLKAPDGLGEQSL